MAHARQHSLKAVFLLIILFMMVATQVRRVSSLEAQSPTVTIINPLSPTNSSVFDFNASASLVNTTFTAALYISTVTGLCAWQVELSWNNSVINFAAAWIPPDNVFEPAVGSGASLLVTPAATDYENATQMETLTFGCTTFYTSNNPPMYPVNINGEGLLCDVNFTIPAIPNATQTLSTNLVFIRSDPNSPPGYLDTFVYIYPSKTGTPLLTGPASVTIAGSQALAQELILASVIGIAFNLPALYRGQNVTMTATFANNGTELETFNFTISETLNSTGASTVEITSGTMTILPNETDYYAYLWNIPDNLTVGWYTIEVHIEPLQGENSTKYNDLTAVIYIDRTLSLLEYMGLLLSVMLNSRLGILFIAYAVAVICFFIVLSARERLKRRSRKIR